MLRHNSSHSQTSIFRQGMTLDQYFTSMSTIIPKAEPIEKAEEDLYETSREKDKQKRSAKLITYQIRQCDEDNYEETAEQQKFKIRNNEMGMKEDQTTSSKNITFNLQSLRNGKIDSAFQIRRRSNSPYLAKKKVVTKFSPNKILSQTHFLGFELQNQKEAQFKRQNTFSTIYCKFLNGVKHKPQNTHQKAKNSHKQKNFKAKAIKQIDQIAKYQKNASEKYSKYNFQNSTNMIFEDIPDRLRSKKLVSSKKNK